MLQSISLIRRSLQQGLLLATQFIIQGLHEPGINFKAKAPYGDKDKVIQRRSRLTYAITYEEATYIVNCFPQKKWRRLATKGKFNMLSARWWSRSGEKHQRARLMALIVRETRYYNVGATAPVMDELHNPERRSLRTRARQLKATDGIKKKVEPYIREEGR